MDYLPQSTQADAVAELLLKSKRIRAVPLRRTFLQRRGSEGVRPGLLHHIVRSHGVHVLDLYLLVHLVAAGAPYMVMLEAGGWARALGLNGPSGRATVSRSWKRLEDLHLIHRSRSARRAAVTLLREDGSGEAYARPSGAAQLSERYLNIPLAYWRDGWYSTLSLPAKTMLLIALSLPDGFSLPVEKASLWYGISGDTAQRGFNELDTSELLEHEDHYKKASLTTQGWALDRRYTLRAPFGPKADMRHGRTD
jgi:hypothetical protein